MLSTKPKIESWKNIAERGETSSSWGQSGGGTGCLERLCSLMLGDFQK